jgi:hypothetical protein
MRTAEPRRFLDGTGQPVDLDQLLRDAEQRVSNARVELEQAEAFLESVRARIKRFDAVR